MFRSTGFPFASSRRLEVHLRFSSLVTRCLLALVTVIGTAMIAIAAPVSASTRPATVRVSSTPGPRASAVRAGLTPTWALQTVPSPTGPGGALMAVSCSSATDCTAVGSYVTVAGKSVALVERWNGTTWSIEATPSHAGDFAIYLSGVSCTSATACTAVGYYLTRAGFQQTLAESWNGTTWSIQTTPNPNGASMLSGVSCASSIACTAVGNSVDSMGNEMTLAEHWNGTSWSLQTTPNFPGARGSELNGVSCTSATACTAVGDIPLGFGTQRSFAERLNGTSWSLQTTPNPTGAAGRVLSGVSCTSATLCIAVGYSTNASGTTTTLADRWNGSSWSVLTTPNRGGAPGDNLHGVSCRSASVCTAVGGYAATNPGGTVFVERWNGTSWSVQTTPQPSDIWNWFMGVSCPSATACTAVGLILDNQRNGLTLAMGWNGTSWSVQSTPTPIGSQGSSLSAVSCTSPAECTAVGTINLPPGPPIPLAERWDGTKWSIEATANTGSNSYLTAVSCPSGTVCIAVGGSFSPTGSPTLAERWNGTSWSIQATPNPTGAQSSQLSGISCTSPTACTAVGNYTDSTGTQRTLAERWNGTTWSIEKTPNPAGATASGLSGVSCTAATACTAVGEFTDSSGTQQTLAEAWSATGWSVQTTVNPSGATASALTGVSCRSATACTAVGNSTDSSGTQTTLAESWNGTRWAVQTTPEPSGAAAGGLTGVSCTSVSACTAVGDYTDAHGIQLTLAEGWNGTTWAVQSTPNPYTLTGDVLEGVSCTSASVCTAVGVDGYGAPLAERYS